MMEKNASRQDGKPESSDQLERSPGPDGRVEAEIAKLPSLEASLLRSRFGIRTAPQTTAEVAANHSLSIVEVRQIEARALRRLRWRSMSAHDVPDWDEV